MPTPRRQTAKAIQPPLMQEQADPTADLAPEVEVPQLSNETLLFAACIGYVEALAASGKFELIMQVARIAYTRARQVERGESPSQTG